jgi:hypothetical protein
MSKKKNQQQAAERAKSHKRQLVIGVNRNNSERKARFVFTYKDPKPRSNKDPKPPSNKDPKPPSNSGGGRSSQPSPGGSKKEDLQQQSAYQRAQDHISARTPEGRPPEMRIRPGTAVEDTADYTNRLGVFNANYSGRMQDRAEADRYQSGRLLERFTGGLPKAPDVMSGQEMISMANQMNNRINVG